MSSIPQPLKVFATMVLTLTICSWAAAIELWRKGFAEAGGMWSRWNDRFPDIEHYDRILVYLHQPRFFTGSERFAYPAPGAIVYALFFDLGSLRLGVLLSLIILSTVSLGVIFAVKLQRWGLRRRDARLFAMMLVLTAWPVVFLFEHANIEFVLIVLTFAGAAMFWRGRPGVAALLWALAASMKVYPILLLLLFASRSQIKALLLGLVTFAGSLLLSFWLVGPTVRMAANGTLQGITGFVSTYADQVRDRELRFDHSYLALLKAPLTLEPQVFRIDPGMLSHAYFAAVVPLVLVAYFGRFRALPRTNQFLLLTLAMVSLPPVSFDYTLCHLYPGLALLVYLAIVRAKDGQGAGPLMPLLCCFALLLAPEMFLHFSGMQMNGPIKAIAILCATILLLAFSLGEPVHGGVRAEENSAARA